MTPVDGPDDRYAHALEQVRYEGQLLWQIFGAFLLAHTVFMAFLLQSAFNSETPGYQPAVFFPGLVGALLCLPWFAAYTRSSDYYIFRMAQAKAVEPKGWNLVAGQGEEFSDGKPVNVDSKTYRVNPLGRILRTKRSVPLLIIIFLATYLALVVWRGPWTGKNPTITPPNEPMQRTTFGDHSQRGSN
jgi:hypothetical protein